MQTNLQQYFDLRKLFTRFVGNKFMAELKRGPGRPKTKDRIKTNFWIDRGLKEWLVEQGPLQSDLVNKALAQYKGRKNTRVKKYAKRK